MTLSEDRAALSPVLSLEPFSEASVIWRVTDEADFKLAATGSEAIEIKWPGEQAGARPEIKLAAGPQEAPAAEIYG